MKRLIGFSLVELVIVVGLVGILSAIAIPPYQDSIRKSRRTDAKMVLLEASQWMERFYTENNRYDYKRNNPDDVVILPTVLASAPKEGSRKYYTISIAAIAQNTYTLQAVPISTLDQNNDKCKTLTINNLGVKGLAGFSQPPVANFVDDCWQR